MKRTAPEENSKALEATSGQSSSMRMLCTIPECQQAVKIGPNSLQGHFHLANASRRTGEPPSFGDVKQFFPSFLFLSLELVELVESHFAFFRATTDSLSTLTSKRESLTCGTSSWCCSDASSFLL
jgi:hypothetical protein